MRTYLCIILSVSLLLKVAQPTVAQAVDSAMELDIKNEDDILQLQADGRITEEMALVLLEMLED